jgi:hypothetical protein
MKRSLIGVVAIVAAALVVTAGAAGRSARQSGALHVTKECSQYDGTAGSFCTITSSNVNTIKRGMRVVYREAPGDNGVLDTDIVLSSGHGVSASGHVVLNLATAKGAVTLSGGVGRFKRFQADAVVSVDSAGIWHWDGTYRFDDD